MFVFSHITVELTGARNPAMPFLLYGVLAGHKRRIEVSEEAGDIVEGIPVFRGDGVKAYVPIMHGCDNYCSYCIVPYVRGREKSRKPEEIINEINDLAAGGIKEIMLLGQNVNSYEGGISFADLLRRVGGCPGIERVRFMTSHPKDIGRELLEVIRDTDIVCNHLHLPLQSGSTKVLKEMNRKYTKEDYLGILEMAKKIIPGIGLSTDIIVGFPGESEKDFLDTIDVIEKVRFDFAYTFLYSKRNGTPAAEMTGTVQEDVKHSRFNKLLEVQNRITLEENRKNEGKTEIVMVEGKSRTDRSVLTGRTESNKIVNFRAEGGRPGDFAEILITKAKTWHLEGELAKWK